MHEERRPRRRQAGQPHLLAKGGLAGLGACTTDMALVTHEGGIADDRVYRRQQRSELVGCRDLEEVALDQVRVEALALEQVHRRVE